MSKPISFGFGKSKSSQPSISQPSTKKPITLPVTRPSTSVKLNKSVHGKLHGDSDDEDELAPKHEAVTGFSSSGAILSKPQVEKQEKVIANSGNGDWRQRGRKNLLPSEVQAQQETQRNGGSVVTVERNEVSTARGLQYATSSSKTDGEEVVSSTNTLATVQEPEKQLTEDERALAALLSDESDRPRSNAVIETRGNTRLQQKDEVADFREDVATRPESATLEDYAAMPVEEFGMAMLRGMGQKRRANGEVIDLNQSKKDDDPKRKRKQEGFLGIGAKPVPGLQGAELGAWGKADMRKNNRGEGFFTPVMLEDKRTGERMTEEELEKRKREAKDSQQTQNGDEWRERRDRNLERSGRDEGTSASRKRDRNYDSSSSRSRRDRDDRDYDPSRSRRDRDRSRSKERRGKHYDEDHEYRSHDRYRDRDREQRRYKDDDRYESSSSRKSGHKERSYERDDRRHRDSR